MHCTWQQTRLVAGGAWLEPIGDDCYKVGATYEWNQVDELITAEGLSWLTRAAQNLGGPDFTILDHKAGIRPIARKSMPIIGKIPHTITSCSMRLAPKALSTPPAAPAD